MLKGIKFYTYGENQELIGLTGVVDVAEMKDSTLIDHFDAYVSNARINEVKAVIPWHDLWCRRRCIQNCADRGRRPGYHIGSFQEFCHVYRYRNLCG